MNNILNKFVLFLSTFVINSLLHVNAVSHNCSVDAFPGALSTTQDEIRLTGAVKVHGTTELITKDLAEDGWWGGSRCDGSRCTASNTWAETIEIEYLAGDSSDGVLASAWNNKDITIAGNKNYSRVNLGWDSSLTINDDSIIKIAGDFELGGSGVLTVNGNVTIYANNFRINNGDDVIINGSLKIITNGAFHFISGGTVTVNNVSDLVILSKGNLHLTAFGEFKGLFYSAADANVYSHDKVTGAVTGRKVIVNHDTDIYYDGDAVNEICGEDDPPDKECPNPDPDPDPVTGSVADPKHRKKVLICHIPPGNPENVHTISISRNALHTHVSHHGDYDGVCEAVPDECLNPDPVSCTAIFEDDFESGLSDRWRTLKANGGFTPQLEDVAGNHRLRLTNRGKDLSTAVTLDYEFPSENNKFIMEFDYYAYGGCSDNDNYMSDGTQAGQWGADGTVVMLFDSSAGQSPSVGAYGGSLGYANMWVDDEMLPGFQSGWFGIGLDEFGNFKTNDEGRRDRFGNTETNDDIATEEPNSIGIRGSASSGYRLLEATDTLVPSLARSVFSQPNNSYESGRYRITVDMSVAGEQNVTLERDTGSGFVIVIGPFNALDASYNQGQTPESFRAAFSAGTGGGCNHHEIDNVKICGLGDIYSASESDFGDAPESYGDAEHVINDDLYIGAIKPDDEDASRYSYNATGDGDEDDGAPRHPVDLTAPYLFPILKHSFTTYSTPIKVTNNLGSSATLFAWIDFDKNNVFDPDEATSIAVNDGLANTAVTLTWDNIPADKKLGTTFIRLRLTSDSSITSATPFNKASDGEVEDYMIAIAQDIPPSSPDVTVKSSSEPRDCETIIFEDNFDDLATGSLIGANRAGGVNVRDWVLTGGGSDTYAKTVRLNAEYALTQGYTIPDFGTSMYLGNGAVRRVYPSLLAGGISFNNQGQLTTSIEAIELRDDPDDSTQGVADDNNKASDWGPESVTLSHSFESEIGISYKFYFKALPEPGNYSAGIMSAGIMRVDTPAGSVHVKTPGTSDGTAISYSVEFTATETSSTVSLVNYGRIDNGLGGWCRTYDNPWCTVDGVSEGNINEATVDDIIITEASCNESECSIDEATTGVFSTASVTVNSSRLDTNTRVYQTRFNSAKWEGSLLSFDLETTNDDGNTKTQKWNAAGKIPTYGKRKNHIFTYNSTKSGSNKGVIFKWNQLNNVQIKALKEGGVSTSVAKKRQRWILGQRNQEKTVSKPNRILRGRTTVLGDIIHSSPIFAGRRENYGYSVLAGSEGTSYAAFLNQKSTRQNSIYVGANDGMLHGFNADSGVELFAYVPNEVIPNLTKLSAPEYGCQDEDCTPHQYYVDGVPAVGDVYFSDAWHAVLLGTLGKGGKGIFALDVTSPASFTKNNVMWELSATQAANNASTYADHMGYSTPHPSIVKLHNGKWAAIISNGPESDNHQAVLFLIDISNGQLIKAINTQTGTSDTPNGLSSPIPVDTNGDRITDHIYAGDLLGNLWKFDVSDASANNWSVAYTDSDTSAPIPLFTTCETVDADCTKHQEITAKPQVGKHPAGGYMVYFGTGKYSDPDDNVASLNPDIHTLYGIRDNGDVVADMDDLVEQTVLQESTFSAGLNVRVTSNNAVDAATKKGWFMKLVTSDGTREGERIISQALLRDGRLIATTVIPPQNCTWGGASWILESKALTGSRLSAPPLDLNNDRKFTSADQVSYDTNIESPTGIQKTSLGMILSSPEVINHTSSTEGKYVSGSSGDMGMFRESTGNSSGRQSWKQIR